MSLVVCCHFGADSAHHLLPDIRTNRRTTGGRGPEGVGSWRPSRHLGLYPASKPGVWWLALSPQFRRCRCRFRPGSVKLTGAGATEGRQRRAGKLVISRRTADGAYWFIALPPNRPHPWVYFPYYLLVIGATGILCWAAAVWLVSPIRNLTATVERFGRGGLSAHWHTRRRDEIATWGGPSMKQRNVCSDCHQRAPAAR